MKKEIMKAVIVNQDGKHHKTITGTTNTNGYFYKQYNKYCNDKGYTQKIESSECTGSMAWSNGSDILIFNWIK
ncbi:MAG: hypothetical protein PHT02_01310 [Tissierellia bacterium]|nr:hypothetical protein [Tissierellia bacterium]